MSNNTEVELSPEAVAFADFLGALGAPPSELAGIRHKLESVHRAASEPEDVTYSEVDAGGVPAIWATPIGADTDYVLLHNHAGGSVVTSAFVDRKLAGHIAKAVGVPALVLDIRQAPEHKHPAQLDDVEAAFNWLVSRGQDPAKIISIGHSIGGFFSVALALRLRDKGLPMPGTIVSISPWCDLEIKNETITSRAETDKVLSKDLLEFFRSSWLDGTGIDHADVQVNLNRTDLSGLPPTHLSWGTYEILAGEDEEFGERIKAAGVDAEVMPVVGAQHSYVWGAGRVPETDAAIARIASWVREKAGIPDA